mmetsp:Transcript_23948/g.37526  ORF Transcript_23948/g.37526 Transcript_23948/m.37526 type:complete len:204 (+) Transcript_23948:435-1046(+)
MRGLFFALLLPRLVLLLGLAAGTQAFIAGQPLALRGMRTVPQTTCGPSTTYMSLKSSDDPHSGPVGMAKELWIRLESFMVSLSQGTAMGEAMDRMEHERLFPHDHPLREAGNAIKDAHDQLVEGSKTLLRNLGQQTADMREMYETSAMSDFMPSDRDQDVLWKRNVQPSYGDLQLAPVVDCYSSGLFSQSVGGLCVFCTTPTV